jgi:hypothetical protein
LGYAVYAVNGCGEKTGTALATIKALGVPAGGCCQQNMYKATILEELAGGVTSMAFMVVPLTSIGALDVGWVTNAVYDWVNATNNKKNKESAADQASKLISAAPTPAPAAPAAPASTTTSTTAPPVVAVSMSWNVDYDQLSAETKDQLKCKIQAVLATTASVDPSAVTVMLSAGSVKVDAKIQTSDSADAEPVVALLWIGPVLDEINTMPEVKEAAEDNEIALTDVEVKMEAGVSTLNMNQAEAEDSSVVANQSAPAKQAQTSAGNSPSPRLELLLLLLPLVAVWA